LPSHWKVSSEDLLFVKEVRDAGVRVADAFRVLVKQVGGTPFVCFQLNDLYNMLGEYNKKSFDGSDMNLLIEIFKK